MKRILAIVFGVILGISCSSCTVICNEKRLVYDYAQFPLPHYITSPQTLKEWMHTNLRYIPDKNGEWKQPWETIRDGGGDCEDYAILAALFLSKLGYRTNIVGLFYQENGKKAGHAICVFQEKDGRWSFFSDELYVKSKAELAGDIYTKYFPKWERITYFKPTGETITDIKR